MLAAASFGPLPLASVRCRKSRLPARAAPEMPPSPMGGLNVSQATTAVSYVASEDGVVGVTRIHSKTRHCCGKEVAEGLAPPTAHAPPLTRTRL